MVFDKLFLLSLKFSVVLSQKHKRFVTPGNGTQKSQCGQAIHSKEQECVELRSKLSCSSRDLI